MEEMISIIVPVYNVEKYIEKCINSLIKQTYKNLEIILVDDGTPDSSGDICDKYALQDSRIKVIHKENGGLSDARNKGIEAAKGDYIGFVDSDDYINERMYEILINTMKKTGADIVISNLEEVDEGKNHKTSVGKKDDFKITEYNRIQAQNMYYDHPELRIAFTVAWNKLYKRSVIKDIRYPKGLIHEDEFTTFKYLYSAEKTVFVDANLYYYIRRGSSIMGQAFNEKKFQLLEACESRIEFYESTQEWDLWKKAMKHYLHMTVKFNEWMTEAEKDNKDKIYKCRDFYLNQYKKNKRHVNIEFMIKLESILYRVNFVLYYKIWRKCRK